MKIESIYEESLIACIERANGRGRKTRRRMLAFGLLLVLGIAACLLLVSMKALSLFAFSVGFGVLFGCFLKWMLNIAFCRDFAWAINSLACSEWVSAELLFRRCHSFFFNKALRSPSFILVAGFYYRFRRHDETSAMRLLELARSRDASLLQVDMTCQRGLDRKARELLVENFKRDLRPCQGGRRSTCQK